MQSNSQRQRVGSTSLDVPGSSLRSPPVGATQSPIHAVNSAHQSLASPVNALPPSLAVRQMSLGGMSSMDSRQQYIPGPPPGGPPMQLAANGMPLPPPPPRPAMGQQQSSPYHGMLPPPPPPPPGPPPNGGLPANSWGAQPWQSRNLPPPPPGAPPHPSAVNTAYSPAYPSYANQPRYQPQQTRHASSAFEMQVPGSDRPLTSATYIPGNDSYGLGVGVPSLDIGHGSTQNEDDHKRDNMRNMMDDGGQGSSSGVNRRDPLADMGIMSPNMPSEDQLPAYSNEDSNRFRSESIGDEKVRLRQQDRFNSGGASGSDGTNTPMSGKTRESSKTRGDDPESRWPLDRVLIWMAQHGFSNDWQEVFKSLELSGSNFLELGVGSGGRGNLSAMHNIVYPSLAKQLGKNGIVWDGARQTKEREEGQRLRRLIRQAAEGTSYSMHSEDFKSHGRRPSIMNFHEAEHSPDLNTPDTAGTGDHSPGFADNGHFKPPGSPISGRPPGSRRLPYGATRYGAASETNLADSSGRSDTTRDILRNANGFAVRHSPQPSNDSSHLHDGRSRFAGDDGSSTGGSPAQSHFPFNGQPTPPNAQFEHSKNDSLNSVSSLREPRRRGTNDGSRPPPVDTASHTSDGPSSGNQNHRGFLGIFSRKRGKHSDDNPDSPTSPAGFRNGSTPYSKANSSEISVDRPISTQSVSESDKAALRGWGSKRKSIERRFVFATSDGINYRLVDVTHEDGAESLRHMILTSMFPDHLTENAMIYLTEPGQAPDHHEQPLSNNSLLHWKRTRADSHGSMKVFIAPGRPLPKTAVGSIQSMQSAETAQPSPTNNTFDKILRDNKSTPNAPRPRALTNSQQSTEIQTLDSQAIEEMKNEAYGRDGPMSDTEKAEREAVLQAAIKKYREEIAIKKQAWLAARGNRQGTTTADTATLQTPPTPSRPLSIQGKGIIDFDTGRDSPFQKPEVLPENLAPKRGPPPAPSAGSETLRKANSLYRKSGDSTDGDGKRLSGEDQLSVSPGRRSATSGSGIGATLAGIGGIGSSDASPRLDVEVPHGTLSPPALSDNENRSKQFGATATSGRSPDSPGFMSGHNGMTFKVPDYESGSSTPTSALRSPDLAKKQQERGLGAIARIAAGNNSGHDDISDSAVPTRTMSVASHRSFGPSFEVKDEVHFPKSPALQQQSDSESDDDDSDDGLFARPIGNKKQSKVPAARPRSKPNLNVDTRHSVSFKDQSSEAPGKSSMPDSATTASSPDTKLNRRKSLIQRSNVWANRPPVEAILQDLDAHFPNVDLDEPVVETTEGSPPVTPTSAIPPVPPTPEVIRRGNMDTSTMMSHKARPLSIATEAIQEEDEDGEESTIKASDSVAKRNLRKSGLGRKKTIREVARQSMLIKRQSTLHQRDNGSRDSYAAGKPMGDLHRRKSTKMFGHNIVQMIPGRGSRESLVLHQQQMSSKLNKRATTFRILRGELIGKGTYGRVYLGINATTGEVLAIKNVTVNKSHAGKDKDKMKELVGALDREIDTMQHLEHPNIVQYLGSERGEFAISIFLEYIEGGSIGSCLRRHGKFEERVVKDLTRQTLDGLSYLHGQGILHRDLKADNILLDTDGTCKISDFGISKRSDDIYGNDASNNMQGSVFWMAPEVVRSQGQGYSAKVDIWSLGCVVLEMFCGRRPWGREEAMSAIYKLTNNRAPPIPEDVEKSIQPESSSFMYDCFTIDPGLRPTAETLKKESHFCKFDEYYNFMDTELYKKLKGIKEFNT